MNPRTSFTQVIAIAATLTLLVAGCARRMTVATGTTIGLHATPGDGQSQTPQVTLAYKRSEIALVPTGEKAARKDGIVGNTDAYSTLAIIDFRTKWFRGASIDQFIATGHAARDIQDGTAFTETLLHGLYTEPSAEIVKRRNALAQQIAAKFQGKSAEEQNMVAVELLKLAGYPDVRQPATNVLQRALEDVRTDGSMKDLESAFIRVP